MALVWMGSWLHTHRCWPGSSDGRPKLTPPTIPIPAGGNAGHSAALCGRVLGLPVRVIVPKTTKPLMLDKIRAQGAEVEVGGWMGSIKRERWTQWTDGREELGEHTHAWSKFARCRLRFWFLNF